MQEGSGACGQNLLGRCDCAATGADLTFAGQLIELGDRCPTMLRSMGNFAVGICLVRRNRKDGQGCQLAQLGDRRLDRSLQAGLGGQPSVVADHF